jgi:hypothetical protein
MIITLFFIFGIVYNILQTKTIEHASFSIDNNINNSVYLLFLVLGHLKEIIQEKKCVSQSTILIGKNTM